MVSLDSDRQLTPFAESAVTASKINWATFSRFSAYRNAALANASTTIIFDAENYDIGNNYDTSNGRYTAPVAGHYHFDAQITLSASYSNYIWTNILVNGTARHRGQRLSSSNTNGMSVVVSADVQLNAGDYVQISCAMGAPAAAEVGNVGGSMTWFMGRLVALN